MKKLLATLISLSVMAGSAFARGMYNGDVQLHLGTGMDSFTSEKISDLNFDVKSNTFDFDVASWHLFSLNDLFSVGFMVDFNGGVGATKDVTYFGLNYVSYSAGGVGFGAEINAKFFPKSKVSPLVGFKFSVLGTNEYERNLGGTTTKVEEKVTIYNTEYFAGIAFNF